MEAAPTKRDDGIALAPGSGQFAATEPPISGVRSIPQSLAGELWLAAEAGACGLTADEFAAILSTIAAKHNCGLPPGAIASSAQQESFLRALHLPELTLAHACALGREPAWDRFLRTYRAALIQSAIAITGSETLGRDLADSLHAELYGLRSSADGERRSPFASYSGRGSLLSWLRTTLVQRFRDHHRRTHRESPLDEIDHVIDRPAAEATPPIATHLQVLAASVAKTLEAIEPEDRFLLSSYYLDRQTLLQIARLLNVHEATISRRLKRLAAELRKRLIANLERTGMSRRAAEEMLGADPRDIEINLRKVLQTSQIAPFSDMGSTQAAPTPQTASSPASETR